MSTSLLGALGIFPLWDGGSWHKSDEYSAAHFAALQHLYSERCDKKFHDGGWTSCQCLPFTEPTSRPMLHRRRCVTTTLEFVHLEGLAVALVTRQHGLSQKYKTKNISFVSVFTSFTAGIPVNQTDRSPTCRCHRIMVPSVYAALRCAALRCTTLRR